METTVTNNFKDNLVVGEPIAQKSPKTQLSNEEIKHKLDFIFQKISNKEQTKQGMQELYDFKKEHSYASAAVESKLDTVGAYFQGYIRRGLAHLEELKEVLSTTQSTQFTSSLTFEEKETGDRPVLNSTKTLSSTVIDPSQAVTATTPKLYSSQQAEQITLLSHTADRSLAVAELKERLAKMKMAMNQQKNV
jgi:hypothetical protein